MKKIIVIAGIILLAILAFIAKTYHNAGEWKKLNPHFEGTVQPVYGIIGGEDITIDHHRQIAYISADDRFALWHGGRKFGGIYSLSLKQGAKPKLLRRIPETEIHPHGISLYQSPEGTSFLFAVDHFGGKNSILLFRFQDDSTLALERSFEDAAFMISPNDIAAVDERRFYFTNDHGSPPGWERKREEYLQLKQSNVVYFDGANFSIAAKRIAFANGINISRNRNELYVAGTIGKSILVYHRDTSSGQLSLKNEIYLGTGADNIELDEAGNLWVACHPKLLTFLKHASDTSRLAPSQVFKILRNEQGDFSCAEVYLNEGEQISASSVAAVTGNVMLIGPVFESHLLRCEINRR